MKIAILSANPKLYTTRRLKEACERRGHKVRILDPLCFSIHLEQGRPSLHYNEKPLGRYDAVIPRIGTSITFFGTAVVRQFESMGVFCLNPSLGISMARDKLRCIQVLSRHGIGIPRTAFVRRKEAVLPAIDAVGGAPVIIKLLEGTQGIGVILADQVKIAEAIIETLQTTKQNVLIQSFVRESRGKDVRALVVGGRVVAAMRRTAQGEEFRSNVHRGGSTEALQLDPVYERTALEAAQIVGLQVAGVDMLEGADGPKVMEVNSSPGLEGIETATAIDVADAIVEHVEDMVQFPEFDLRQRLTLDQGYAVAEVPVPRKSTLVDLTVAESGLRQRDVLVLSIKRQGTLIPSVHGETRILAGDVLLCYGQRATLTHLLPEPRRRVVPREAEQAAEAPAPTEDAAPAEDAAGAPLPPEPALEAPPALAPDAPSGVAHEGGPAPGPLPERATGEAVQRAAADGAALG